MALLEVSQRKKCVCVCGVEGVFGVGGNGGLRQKSCICTRGIEGLDTLQGHSQLWDPRKQAGCKSREPPASMYASGMAMCLTQRWLQPPTWAQLALQDRARWGQEQGWIWATQWTLEGAGPRARHKGSTARVSTTGHGQSPLPTSPEAGGSLGRNLSLASAPVQSNAALSISKQ